MWVFKPTNALEERSPIRVRWDFTLPDGGRFTDDRFACLLESSRQLIALIRSRSLSTGLAQRASTAGGNFKLLRELLRWMNRTGFARFADLDATALLQFHRTIAERSGHGRAGLSPTTVQQYLRLFTYLYRFRDQLNDALRIDPFPGRTHGEVAGVYGAEIRHWPYTPDGIAVALVQGAIELVATGASRILRAKRVYAEAMTRAAQRGCSAIGCTCAAKRALQQSGIDVGADRKLSHF